MDANDRHGLPVVAILKPTFEHVQSHDDAARSDASPHLPDLDLDILSGLHEGRGRPAVESDGPQQRGVHVVADAEREDTPMVRVALLRGGPNRLLGGLAVRRIPEIGQEGDPRFARIA